MGNGFWILEGCVLKVRVSNLLQNLNMDSHPRRPHRKSVLCHSPIFLDCGGLRSGKSTLCGNMLLKVERFGDLV